MKLLNVLVGFLFTMPAFAHHETTTAASTLDGTTLTLISALTIVAIIAAIRAFPQLKHVRTMENDK